MFARQPRSIALQNAVMSFWRNSLLHPARLNLLRFDSLSALALMMVSAMRLRAAKLVGA